MAAASSNLAPVLTQTLIQDAFHFDTNQFLVPEDGESALLDYDDLFSLLNQPAEPGGGGSNGGEPPAHITDSDGFAASAAPPQATPGPARQSILTAQQLEPKALKSSRDLISKRSRDGSTARSKVVLRPHLGLT